MLPPLVQAPLNLHSLVALLLAAWLVLEVVLMPALFLCLLLLLVAATLGALCLLVQPAA